MAFSQSNQNNFRITTRNCKPEITSKIAHYFLGQPIGKGGFATVHKAIDLYTKVQVAIKVIDFERMTQKQQQSLKREISIHRKLNHPNIPKLYEVIKNNERVYMVMELVKGVELFQHISQNGALPEKQAVKVFEQLCGTVKYLHDQGIAHRDIKAENIMIDSSFKVKLLDFGLSKNIEQDQDIFNQTFCGSPSYSSPEIIDKKMYFAQQIDIWCLGVTLFVMLQAILPFDDDNHAVRKENIRSFNWHRTNYSSEEAIEVYNKIFVPSEQRIKIRELLTLRLFSKFLFERGNMVYAKRILRSAVENNLYLEYISKISEWLNKTQTQVQTEIFIQKFGQSFAIYQCLLSKSEDQFIIKRIKTDEARASISYNKRYSRIQRETGNKIYMTPNEKRTKLFSIQNYDIKATVPQKLLKNNIQISLPDQQQVLDSIRNNKSKIHPKNIFSNNIRINKSNVHKLSCHSESLVIKNCCRTFK